MAKKIFPIFTIICVMLAAGLVLAKPSQDSAKPENKTAAIPKTAKQIGDGVYDLGWTTDKKTGEKVEGRAIVHYKKGDAGSNGKISGAKAVQCYGYLARGGNAKWRLIEPWVMNPSNIRGLDGNSAYSNLAADILKWEDAGDGSLNNIGVNILGDGSMTAGALAADTASPDGVNEVYFANVSDQGAIAITIVWGIFSGPSSNQKLVEWDQVYDDVDFDWSLSGEAGKMDFENIATHELGHSVGMGDLYNSSCGNETMYGYATEEEIKKRDLNSGDIIGINKLY